MLMARHLEPIALFLSYANEDEALLRKLETHLSLLKRQHLISIWHNRQTSPGSDWGQERESHLQQASLILLLVSSDFLASDSCYDVEMQQALERYEANGARVIPLILRPCTWRTAPFGHFACLPHNGTPVTMWDNEDAAWNDVERGIRQVISDLSFPAAHATTTQTSVTGQDHRESTPPTRRQTSRFGAPFPAIWNVSRRHTPFFTGRDQVLQQLADGFLLESGVDMVQPQAIIGLGGMGKTQIAAEYAYRFRGEYQAILWVRAETQETLTADFKTMAELLEVPQEYLQDRVGLIQAVRDWFMDHSDWLLIFDNADDLALVDSFLPRAARGHILLTTRAGAVVELAQPVALEALEPADGALCILRRAGVLKWNEHLHQTSSGNVVAAQTLSQKMSGLPLALVQAGAYINDTACSLNEYLQLYEHYRPRLQRLSPGAVSDYPRSVASAWMISRMMVDQSNPAATELLRFCANLAPESIPVELLLQGAPMLGPLLGPVASDTIALNQIIGLLRTYSLLNREAYRGTETSRLSIHRIMQEILLDEMDDPTRLLWAQRAVQAVAQALPSLPGDLLLPHVQHCLRLIEHWQLTFSETERLRHYVAERQ
jgi:hypothetical protein